MKHKTSRIAKEFLKIKILGCIIYPDIILQSDGNRNSTE